MEKEKESDGREGLEMKIICKRRLQRRKRKREKKANGGGGGRMENGRKVRRKRGRK